MRKEERIVATPHEHAHTLKDRLDAFHPHRCTLRAMGTPPRIVRPNHMYQVALHAATLLSHLHHLQLCNVESATEGDSHERGLIAAHCGRGIGFRGPRFWWSACAEVHDST